MPSKSNRNREMLIAFKSGRTVEQLCNDHHLNENRVRSILMEQKHKCIVSPEPFYRMLRQG
jgi:hypothetical protein